MSLNLNVNGKKFSVDAEPDTPLLWVLRDELKLIGTKFGCGQALCGACTVHADGSPIRSCQTSLADAASMKIVTIEGIQGKAADKRAEQTYKDAEAVLHECMQIQQHLAAQDAAYERQTTELKELIAAVQGPSAKG